MFEEMFEVPSALRRGALRNDQPRHLDSAYQLLNLMCRELALPDLAQQTVLDMGCGTKLVQAVLTRNLPMGRYIGVDVARSTIDYLREEVDDSRFEFHQANTHNAMYNPDGEPLASAPALPVAQDSVDIICLFSVFTHLAPHDYADMLVYLRPYIRPGGHLLYSLFVNETTVGGHGYVDKLAGALQAKGKSLDPEAVRRWREQGPPAFVDDDPSRPLLRAMYSRQHALDLVQGTGWAVESLNDPEPGVQHFMICRPI